MEGVQGAIRQVQPLAELWSPFDLSRASLETVERGARDPDLDPLVQAAIHIARTEDKAVFHGWPAAGIGGMCERSPHQPLIIPESYEQYPALVENALRQLIAVAPELQTS